MAVLWIAMAQILINFTDSSVPWSDAFTTSLSIIAMWMLARKYAEQWLAWLVVDAVCVALYIYKGIYFYATLYAIYTVIAYVGYRKWLRLMQKQ
jgi:nicotinamide mononucleotide transporter